MASSSHRPTTAPTAKVAAKPTSSAKAAPAPTKTKTKTRLPAGVHGELPF